MLKRILISGAGLIGLGLTWFWVQSPPDRSSGVQTSSTKGQFAAQAIDTETKEDGKAILANEKGPPNDSNSEISQSNFVLLIEGLPERAAAYKVFSSIFGTSEQGTYLAQAMTIQSAASSRLTDEGKFYRSVFDQLASTPDETIRVGLDGLEKMAAREGWSPRESTEHTAGLVFLLRSIPTNNPQTAALLEKATSFDPIYAAIEKSAALKDLVPESER